MKRYLIYERALKFLPGSYKLWHAYLQERRQAVEGKVPVTHARYQILVNTYERCVRGMRGRGCCFGVVCVRLGLVVNLIFMRWLFFLGSLSGGGWWGI